MSKKIWILIFAALAVILVSIFSSDYNKAASSAVMRDCIALVSEGQGSLEVLKITSVSNLVGKDESSATGDLKSAFDQGLLAPYHIGVIADYRSGSRRAISHCSYRAVLDVKSKKFVSIRLESFLNGLDVLSGVDVLLHAPLKVGFLDKAWSFIPIGKIETNHYIGRDF